MSKSIKQYKGNGHTLNVELDEDLDEDEGQYEVWFEDFCILGIGTTVIGALKDAQRWIKEVGTLVDTSLGSERQ